MNAELDKIKSGSSAVILCGGKSTRMAQDKAGLLIGKKTFLQQIEENLKDADEILLSVKDRRDYPEIGARHIEDRETDKGPLMGLCSDAVNPVDRTGKKYVLCAWYRKSILEILKEQLESGDLKVKHLLERLRVCYVAVEGLTDGSRKFQNINTREEYQTFTERSAVRLEKELHTDIPIVSFVAYSGTGKTTFLERLIPKLKARGLKIAIVKHDGHRFEIDHEGKDSDRFTKAGADVTGLISSEKAVLIENRQTDPEEFLKKIDGVDLILTEGFKQGPWPKIMLHRKGTRKPMPLLPEECLAVISDVEILGCKNVFPLEEIEKTADFLFRYIQNIS